MYIEFFTDIALSIFMVGLTTIIFYEILRLCWERLPKLKTAPRKRVILVVLTIFAAHTVCIWTYGALYYTMVEYLFIGNFRGVTPENTDFIEYVNFSAEAYSSLGIGDMFPEGPFRFMAGVEAINGLVLIGWSVSFTFLSMEKFWILHKKRDREIQ